jgi:MFS family permease
MMCADWMQGPYVYELYASYGFDKVTIGYLFVAGFGSSAVCGPIIGALADTLGRKRMCIIFGISYFLSCVTKHYTDLSILYLGRVLGGIATSILFSSFEAWMVTHHNNCKFPMSLLGDTFSWAWGWNGMVAVSAGIVTGYAASYRGPVAAFDCSMVMLTIGTAIVLFTWKENYGQVNLNVHQTLSASISAMRSDPKIIILGSIQSLFEGAMYLFVFMWTPAIDDIAPAPINHGWMFANFMLSCMIGTELFTRVTKVISVEKTLIVVFACASASMFLSSQFASYYLRMGMFCLFELCVGAYWPAIGMQRSKYVPDQIKSTVMNLFRVPLNLIVILSLLNIGSLSVSTTFSMCSALHLGALLAQMFLERATHKIEAEVNYSTVSQDEEGLELGTH